MATFRSNKGEFKDEDLRKYVDENFNKDTYAYLVNQGLIRPGNEDELKQRATYYGLTQLLGMPESEAAAAMASIFEKGSQEDLNNLAKLYERSMIIGVPTSALQEAAAKVGLTSTDSYDIQRYLADRGINTSAVAKGTPSYESIVELGPQINAKDNPIQGGNLIFQPGYDAPGSDTNIYNLAKGIVSETDPAKRAELEQAARAEQDRINAAARAEAEAEAAANIAAAKAKAQANLPSEDLNVKRPGYGGREGQGVDIAGSTGLRDAYVDYVERMLERASAEADVPFQAYQDVSPLIQKAKSGIANLKTPGQFRQGSNLATAAGIGALDYGQYKPTQFTTGTFANPLQGTRGDIINFAQNYADRPATSQEVSALDNYLKSNPNTTFQGGVNQLLGINPPPTGKAYGGEVEGYDDGGTVNVGGDTTNPYTVPANPNLQPVNYGGQNVTNVQASYMSPYMQNVVDVQQREAKRQADIANQAIGAKAAQAGAFGGTRHGLMEAEANRNLQTQLGGIQAKGLQDAFSQGLSQFNVEQNRGLEAQKLGEQSRQFGAELGLKGLQTGIQSAGVLGQLGAAESASDLARLKTLYDMGTGERTFDYNEFLRSEKYPYENLKFMQSMLTGLPIDAAASGVSPSANALKALLASAGVLFPDG